jgi:hypothetical protein
VQRDETVVHPKSQANPGGHLSCDFFSYYNDSAQRYGSQEAVRRSHFEKLNFDAVRETILHEGIDCEFKHNGGGWTVYLTQEEFRVGLRDVESMRCAGGYVSSLRIFEGAEAAKVYSDERGLRVGCWSEDLCWGDIYSGKSVFETVRVREFADTDSGHTVWTAIVHSHARDVY